MQGRKTAHSYEWAFLEVLLGYGVEVVPEVGTEVGAVDPVVPGIGTWMFVSPLSRSIVVLLLLG